MKLKTIIIWTLVSFFLMIVTIVSVRAITIDASSGGTPYTAGVGLSLNNYIFSLNYLFLSNFTNDAGFITSYNTTFWSLTGDYLFNNSGNLDFNETALNVTINALISNASFNDTNESVRVESLITNVSLVNGRVDTVNDSLQSEITLQANNNISQNTKVDAVNSSLQTQVTQQSNDNASMNTKVDAVITNVSTQVTQQSNDNASINVKIDAIVDVDTDTNWLINTSVLQNESGTLGILGTFWSDLYATLADTFSRSVVIANFLNVSDQRYNDTYTAGNGISLSTTTFSVVGNTALTQDADGLSVTADGITDTQLAFNTGQHLTTTNTPTFANQIIGGSIHHDGDTHTSIDFFPDQITISTGGVDMVIYSETDDDSINFNPSTIDIDFKIDADNVTDAFKMDAGLKTATFNVPLAINGNITLKNSSIVMCSPYSGVPCYEMYINATLWNCRNATGLIMNAGNTTVTCS